MRLHPDITIRKARARDVRAIAQLNNAFADEKLMLRRTPEMIDAALDDYLVAVDGTGAVLACGALKEYSPSLAEVAAIAVDREAHGRGLGKAIVRAVEALALRRGITHVFALTLQPEFFTACGYSQSDVTQYPEKIRRDCIGCARRVACDEYCFTHLLAVPASLEVAA